MKLGWVSDVHLNFLDDSGRGHFFSDLSAHEVDAWIVAGDIGEADSITGYLRDFERLLSVIALVGDDGWSDGRLGNPMGTPVELNDFHLISELQGHTRTELIRRLNQLGDEAAARLRMKLDDAADRCTNVVVVTHPPPFKGACWHEGRISSPDWLPWFSCEAVGTAITESADAHPNTRFLVLCGHTHGGGLYSPRANVVAHTASAEYGRPGVQAVIEFDKRGRLISESISKCEFASNGHDRWT